MTTDAVGIIACSHAAQVHGGYVYGEGVVLQFEGAGERAKVQVNFSEGAKWLMVSYANLQTLDA